MLGADLAQLDLQLGPLAGRVVQGAPGIGQLGLVQRLEAGELSATHLLALGDLEMERAVFDLQAPHLVDVDSQAVIEMPQFLLLLQPGDARRAQRGGSGAAPGPLPHRRGGRHRSRHGANNARGNGRKREGAAGREKEGRIASGGRGGAQAGRQKKESTEGRWAFGAAHRD